MNGLQTSQTTYDCVQLKLMYDLERVGSMQYVKIIQTLLLIP